MKVDDFKTCFKDKVRQDVLALNHSASGQGAMEVSYEHVNKFLDSTKLREFLNELIFA
jgi:hypothetical protein